MNSLASLIQVPVKKEEVKKHTKNSIEKKRKSLEPIKKCISYI
jgi:hypothetical protein